MRNVDEKIKLFFQYQILIDIFLKYKIALHWMKFRKYSNPTTRVMFNMKVNQIKIAMPKVPFMQ